ncbi:MAG: helix-turn-helix transcriptional regulator [Clostridia bacterium]|nr:helix-turn-helix transcriptional regulator [Clostridia bacterium]
MTETYRIFRLYCQFSIEEVAAVTKIRKKRLLEIETGAAEPTDAEVEKLSSLYNVTPQRMRGSLSDTFSTIIREPNDYSFYKSEAERELMKETIISLSDAERNIIMMLRTADNKNEMFRRIAEILSEDENVITDE